MKGEPQAEHRPWVPWKPQGLRGWGHQLASGGSPTAPPCSSNSLGLGLHFPGMQGGKKINNKFPFPKLDFVSVLPAPLVSTEVREPVPLPAGTPQVWKQIKQQAAAQLTLAPPDERKTTTIFSPSHGQFPSLLCWPQRRRQGLPLLGNS